MGSLDKRLDKLERGDMGGKKYPAHETWLAILGGEVSLENLPRWEQEALKRSSKSEEEWFKELES